MHKRGLLLTFLCLLVFCCGCNSLYQFEIFRRLFGKDEDDYDYLPYIGVWIEAPYMPTPRAAACAAIGPEIYVCGGEDSTGALDTVEMLDTDADTWTPLQSLPAPTSGHVCVALDDKVYVFGGIGGSCVYDPGLDQWNSIAAPQPTLYASAAVYNGQIYYFGGALSGGYTCTTAQVYDPLLDSWSGAATMPESRAGAFCQVIENRIYVSGGCTNPGGGGPDTYTETLLVYNPIADSWVTRRPMCIARSHGCSGMVNGRMIVFGGFDGVYPGLPYTEAYKPSRNSWRRLRKEPSMRSFTCGATVGTRVYVIGGKIGASTYTATVREFVAPWR
jgi:N-acetylneuraminic acid mutarotase